MPSSKGKPTDPKLREEVKEGMALPWINTRSYSAKNHLLMRLIDVKNETNKDGSGKGQMTAWKVRLLFPVMRDSARLDFTL